MTTVDIGSVVDEIIAMTGREPDKVIHILQEVQKRLNWIPSDALKHICKVTDITREQISGVSTFYSQFRHLYLSLILIFASPNILFLYLPAGFYFLEYLPFK